MATDYGYDLFFKREQMWDVVRAVAKIAAAYPGRQTTIVFPDHELTLPFQLNDSDNKPARLPFDDPMRRRYFSMSLYFEVDDEIHRYIEESQAYDRECGVEGGEYYDAQGRAAIGYIDLWLNPDLNAWNRKDYDPSLARLSFAAVTKTMSLLFERSPSIRKTFINCLEQYQGIYGLFGRDEDAEVLWLRGEYMNEIIPDSWTPLYEIESIVSSKRQPF